MMRLIIFSPILLFFILAETSRVYGDDSKRNSIPQWFPFCRDHSQVQRFEGRPILMIKDIDGFSYRTRDLIHSFFSNAHMFSPEGFYFFEIVWDQLSNAYALEPNKGNGIFRNQFFLFFDEGKTPRLFQALPFDGGIATEEKSLGIRFPFDHGYYLRNLIELSAFEIGPNTAEMKEEILRLKKSILASSAIEKTTPAQLKVFFQKNFQFAAGIKKISATEKFRQSCARLFLRKPPIPFFMALPASDLTFGLIKENTLVQFRK